MIEKLAKFDNLIDRTEVINPTLRDEDNTKFLAWIGASVIPKLDVMKELWIKRDKYMAKIPKKRKVNPEKKIKRHNMMLSGLIYLKKKIAFKWE